jgi:hypothetical protein
MTAASPTAMSSFRPRYRAVERQERAHEREWRSQSEPAQNKIFISMNGASQVASTQGGHLGRTITIPRCEELHTVANPLMLENQLVPTASAAANQNIRFSGTPNGVQTPVR